MKYPKFKGYITLLSVIIVGALGLAITSSLLLFGLNDSRTVLSYQQMFQAKNLANSCAEEALQVIRENTNFSGNGNLILGTGTCSYGVTNTGGENRQIDTSGISGNAVRKVRVNLNSINPLIQISSWQEI